jgi:hypothetical protein
MLQNTSLLVRHLGSSYAVSETEDIALKSHVRTLASVLLAFFVIAGAQALNAQIMDSIHARVDHSFVIGDQTLPPGEYTFRVSINPDESLMTAISENGKTSAQFLVRQSVDNHTPNHSELVFRKYGNTEFLSKIFEVGSKDGLAVLEPSKQEAQVINAGQQALEHSEEQK